VLQERGHIGDIGPRHEDVGRIRPASFEADFQVLGHLLDLLRHIAFADDIPILVEGQLATDDDTPAAALHRHDDRGRTIETGRSDDHGVGLRFDRGPVLVALFVFSAAFSRHISSEARVCVR
jgi:hypothetical protein